MFSRSPARPALLLGLLGLATACPTSMTLVLGVDGGLPLESSSSAASAGSGSSSSSSSGGGSSTSSSGGSSTSSGVESLDAGGPTCTVGQDFTCNDRMEMQVVAGKCLPDGTCTCVEGFELNPETGRCRYPVRDAGVPVLDAGSREDASVVLPDGGVCLPGADQTCNDDGTVSSFEGTCQADGTCACHPGTFENPETGRCRMYRDSCESRGGTCQNPMGGQRRCPQGQFNPFSGEAGLCPNSTQVCCLPQGDIGGPCTSDSNCSGDLCLPGGNGYPVGGMCTSNCFPGDSTCPDYAVCLPVVYSQRTGMCFTACNDDGMCRNGWSCQAFPQNPIRDQTDPVYVCWEPGGSWGKGLGERCAGDMECLSLRCRAAPGHTRQVCTAACDATTPCLSGFACQSADSCDTPGCRSCFP